MTKYVVNCLWDDWTDESACSKTCGFGGTSGVKHQERVKLQKEDHGGTCIGNSTRLSACYPNTNCPSRLILSALVSYCTSVTLYKISFIYTCQYSLMQRSIYYLLEIISTHYQFRNLA